MKNAKIILVSILVLSVLGGVLANRVKNSFAYIYCLTPTTCQRICYELNGEPDVETTDDPCYDTVFYTEGQCQTSFPETTVYKTDCP